MGSILRIAAAVVVVAGAGAACGSGGTGGAHGHVAVRAAIRHGACLPVHPGISPFRGSLTLVRSDGRHVAVDVGPRGHGQTSLAPGRYRLVPPLPQSTVHLEVDGRAIGVIGRAYPLRIAAGRSIRLALVILPRRGECTSGGASA
jgi:hypothetical protein